MSSSHTRWRVSSVTHLVLGVDVRACRDLRGVLPSPTSRSRATRALAAVSGGTQGGRRRKLVASAEVVFGPGPLSSSHGKRGSLITASCRRMPVTSNRHSRRPPDVSPVDGEGQHPPLRDLVAASEDPPERRARGLPPAPRLDPHEDGRVPRGRNRLERAASTFISCFRTTKSLSYPRRLCDRWCRRSSLMRGLEHHRDSIHDNMLLRW